MASKRGFAYPLDTVRHEIVIIVAVIAIRLENLLFMEVDGKMPVFALALCQGHRYLLHHLGLWLNGTENVVL